MTTEPKDTAPFGAKGESAKPRVSANFRLASIAASVIAVVFAAKTSHWLPELGLALITGSAFFVTPELLAVIMPLQSQLDKRAAAKTYLYSVLILAVVIVGAVVLASGYRHPHWQKLSVWKYIVLFVAATFESLLLAGVVPIWLSNIAPKGLLKWLLSIVEWMLRPLRHGIEVLDNRGGFLFLGGLLFLVGTLIQFIVGA
jgi:hypothetical protein